MWCNGMLPQYCFLSIHAIKAHGDCIGICICTFSHGGHAGWCSGERGHPAAKGPAFKSPCWQTMPTLPKGLWATNSIPANFLGCCFVVDPDHRCPEADEWKKNLLMRINTAISGRAMFAHSEKKQRSRWGYLRYICATIKGKKPTLR